MEHLDELANVAGIAGVAVGASVLVFRVAIARSTSWPPATASRLVNRIAVYSFAVALAAIAVRIWIEVRPSAQERAAARQADCLKELADLPSHDASLAPPAAIEAGGSVKAGRRIAIRADRLERKFIQATCGDVTAEDIDIIIGSVKALMGEAGQ
ncbi:hypothetical protein [Consotaella salsifontis]|uniref:hypothetical protein n=1 Tax=Consotaella salsifontis TaxID=1365950 RepID=UPI001054E764|nr:hypothetical protein [Consotaella salsifontis]